MEKLELSIIIPLYNCEKYFRRTLECLRRQGVFEAEKMRAEVIMVNDGSTDATLALAEEAANEYPQIRIFSQPNSGQHIARNLGIDNARGKYVYMMDNDDVIVDGALRYALDKAEEYDIDVVHFDYSYVTEEELNNSRRNPVKESAVKFNGSGYDYIEYTNGIGYHYGLWTYIIRRDFLDSHKLRFPEAVRWGEDYAFVWSLFLRNPSTLYLDFVGYYWIRHESSDSHKAQTDYAHRKARKLCCHDLALFFRSEQEALSDKLPANINERVEYLPWIQAFAYWGMLLRCGIEDYDKEVVQSMVNQKGAGIYPIPFRFPSAKFYDMRGLKFRLMWHIISTPILLKSILKYRRSK